MNGKINFGADFLYAMLETNARSKESSSNSLALARVFLILEWGLNTEEQDQANALFWKKANENTFDHFPDVARRLADYIKNVPEAKSKLLTDLIVVTGLDGDLSEDEKKFIQAFAELLDFRPSEVLELFDRAEDISSAFIWFANNNGFVSKKN